MTEKQLHALLIGAIKRVWRRHPTRLAVLKSAEVRLPQTNKDGSRAKRDAVFYKCSLCRALAKSQRSSKYPQIHIDHIDPIIPIERELKSIDEIVPRIFCSTENLMALCENCHSQKTKLENEKRRYYAKLRKGT